MGALYRRSPDGHAARYGTAEGLAGGPILALAEDAQGRVWAGTFHGLCRLLPDPIPGRQVVERVYITRDGLAAQRVDDLLPAASGDLWAATAGGLSRSTADQLGKPAFQSYSRDQGLSDLRVKVLAQDRDGNLWAGTESSGVMRIPLTGFLTYGTREGLGHARVRAIFEIPGGGLQVISEQLLVNWFDGKRFHFVRPNTPGSGWGWKQTVLRDHAGEWWVPTADGLFRFAAVDRVEELAHRRPLAVYSKSNGLPHNEVFRLFEDSRGDIWIGTLGDSPAFLSRWERATGTFHHYGEADGLPPRAGAPNSFGQDQSGQVWIGLSNGVLARYRDGRLSVFTEKDGVPAGNIWDLYTDRTGRLWIASAHGGLARVDRPGEPVPRFTAYAEKQGLSSSDVYCVTEDALEQTLEDKVRSFQTHFGRAVTGKLEDIKDELVAWHDGGRKPDMGKA